MSKPCLIIVGADKGGVGKTTISRTLLDYLEANNVQLRAFDTESPRGALQRFHPDVTEVVDIGVVADQMRIFDTLDDSGTVTVIDVRAGLLSPTLKAMRDFGFMDAAKAGQMKFVVFHILGSSIASLEEIAETATFMSNAHYFLLKNHINDTSFFDWDKATYDSYFKRIRDAVEINVPKLNEMSFEQVDLASVPFARFADNKTAGGDQANYSFVLRGYVRHWLANVWAEYERADLLSLIEAETKTKRVAKMGVPHDNGSKAQKSASR